MTQKGKRTGESRTNAIYLLPSQLAECWVIHDDGETGVWGVEGEQKRRWRYKTGHGHVEFETAMNNR